MPAVFRLERREVKLLKHELLSDASRHPHYDHSDKFLYETGGGAWGLRCEDETIDDTP